VLASGVADFDPQPHPAVPPVPPHPAVSHASYAALQLPHMLGVGAAQYYASVPGAAPPANGVKTEDTSRYTFLAPMGPMPIPTLSGPQLPNRGTPAAQYPVAGPAGAGRGAPIPVRYNMPVAGSPVPAPPKPAEPPRIPQVDGPSSSSSDDEQQYAPHSSHPSLPPPKAPAAPVHDPEAINSDLDDSDDDDRDGDGGASAKDMVFCTYDKVSRSFSRHGSKRLTYMTHFKVSRVRNKWKCTFKDGMIHINGKDYLFAKCTG
jgi:transcription initiation factor TFIIA large subunit